MFTSKFEIIVIAHLSGLYIYKNYYSLFSIFKILKKATNKQQHLHYCTSNRIILFAFFLLNLYFKAIFMYSFKILGQNL